MLSVSTKVNCVFLGRRILQVEKNAYGDVEAMTRSNNNIITIYLFF